VTYPRPHLLRCSYCGTSREVTMCLCGRAVCSVTGSHCDVRHGADHAREGFVSTSAQVVVGDEGGRK